MSVVLTRQSTVYRRLSQAKRVAALPYGLRRGLSFLGLVFGGRNHKGSVRNCLRDSSLCLQRQLCSKEPHA